MHCSTSTRRFVTRAVLLLLTVSLAAVVGCPKQEDFPAALDLVVPPTPTDFEITRQGTAYTFSWTISDPTDVDHYLIYLVFNGAYLEPVETTNNPYLYDDGTSLTGVQFAVSAVSVEGVEGGRAGATAP